MRNKLNTFETIFGLFYFGGAVLITVFGLKELYQIPYLLSSIYLILYYFGISIFLTFFISTFVDTSNTSTLSGQDFLIAKNAVWTNRLIHIPMSIFIMYFLVLSFKYGFIAILGYLLYQINDTDTRFQVSYTSEVAPILESLKQRVDSLEKENKDLKQQIEELEE